jgi:hypothetical protein
MGSHPSWGTYEFFDFEWVTWLFGLSVSSSVRWGWLVMVMVTLLNACCGFHLRLPPLQFCEEGSVIYSQCTDEETAAVDFRALN